LYDVGQVAYSPLGPGFLICELGIKIIAPHRGIV